MAQEFEWREDLNIGVDVIDREHQRLFKIINKLFTFQEEEKDSQWTCQEGIKYFKEHAMNHFADEEAYMESIGYEDLEQHQLLHRGFREHTLPALEQELERSDYAPEAVEHFLGGVQRVVDRPHCDRGSGDCRKARPEVEKSLHCPRTDGY